MSRTFMLKRYITSKGIGEVRSDELSTNQSKQYTLDTGTLLSTGML